MAYTNAHSNTGYFYLQAIAADSPIATKYQGRKGTLMVVM